MEQQYSQKFEYHGYFKDYYYRGEYFGSIPHVEKDREVMGYHGRKEEVLTEDVTLDNKKVIKAGTTVRTEIFPICGRQIKNFKS